jgi:hypothetical protein
MPKLAQLAGQRFGRLVAVERVQPEIPRAQWLCVCDCGATTVTYAENLKRGRTKSCGCLPRERVRIFKLQKT